MLRRYSRFLSLVALVALCAMLAGAVSVAADGPNGGGGAASPKLAAGPIAVDSGWQTFSFGAVGTTSGPFTFSTSQYTTVTITDAFAKGDQFQVLDNGVVVNTTSAVPTSTANTTTDPDTALADSTYSHGIFGLPPGTHSLTIKVLASPFGGGEAFLRIDSNDVHVNHGR